tara:strand:+ start:517 stop:1416 length:900 start_codon:yes stop_codon:yes gene_type:complete
MIRLRHTALLLSVLLGISVAAHAQEAEEPAEAPPPELTEEEQAWQRRFERAEGFRIKMLQTRRGVEIFYDFRKRNLESIEDNRTKCQEDLRRANRDTTFSTILHCYRRELLLHLELRQKQRQYAESIYGVSEELRVRTLEKLDTLIEALEAVIDGVESDVFRSTEELIEAKKNLHTVYRVPALLAVLQLDTDRSITWVAHLMHRLLTMTQNTELSSDAFSKASETLTCFEEGEAGLMDIGTVERYEDANFMASQALTHLQSCVNILRESHTLQQAFENPPVEEDTIDEGQSPRRRWRNQ